MPSSSHHNAPRDSPARRQRRRRTHQRTDSNGELLGRYDRDTDELPSPSPTKRRHHDRDDHRDGDRYKERERDRDRQRRSHHGRRSSRAPESEYTKSSSTALSSGQLAQLDKLNRKLGWNEYDQIPQTRPREYDDETRAEHDADHGREREEREIERERRRQEHRERKRRRREEERAAALAGDGQSLAYEHPSNHERRQERKQRRIVSGQALERGGGGGGARGGYHSEKDDYPDDVRRRDGDSSTDPYLIDEEEDARKRKRRKKIYIGIGIVIVLLAIIIPVAVVLSKRNSSGDGSGGGAGGATDDSDKPSNSNLDAISQDSIPAEYKDTQLDPFSWYDTEDFNVTFTTETVGGLSVMGLNSKWDDSTRANDNVPPLNEEFQYGTMKVRGINLGGWLSIEPFITPSFFSGYSTHDNVVDEWTLCEKLGQSNAKTTLEKHYSSWVKESTFKDLQAAGFDHVRIPFSYWAITTFDGDPYVANVSWRYLLRGIEWARKYGLRINLDLHGAPGSQNGWNHSGHQGQIGWLNGTDGTLNGDRTIAIHKQLSEFFTQPRYQNIVTMYGLVNEPRMVELDQDTVLAWTQKAVDAVRANNFTGVIVFGDGFMGLDNWQGKLTTDDNLLLDVHQYVIFNVDQIVLNHHDKINFACGGWTSQALRSQNTATGFGPTLCGEWSQADTDCAKYLNNVGIGSRWEGTLNMISTPGGSSDGSVLTPTCPTDDSPGCSCDGANADPSSYSDAYKQWLLMFAEAQMHSFEQGWGWFYWTWQTESAAQWSYKAGLANGMMPEKAYARSFNCSSDIPQFDDLPEYY